MIKKRTIIFQIIVTIIFCLILTYTLDPILAVAISGFIALAEYYIFRKIISSKYVFSKLAFGDYLNALFEALGFGGVIGYFLKKWIPDFTQTKIILFVFSATLLFFEGGVFLDLCIKKNLIKKKSNKETVIGISVGMLISLFILFVDIPSELYLNNSSEFECSYLDVICSLFPFFFIVFVIPFLLLLPDKVLKTCFALVSGIVINFYIQKMFFNGYIGEITGAHYYWTEHVLHGLINILIWILVFVLCFYLIFRKRKSVYIVYTELVVFLLLFVSLSYIFFHSPLESYQRKQYYLEPSEQFTIGKDKNVIVLIADAVDNEFIFELFDKNPDLFEPYKDFTMFTDTCSVYDTTGDSVCQMLYGYTQKEGTEIVDPFFNRFREAGYRILFFHAAALANGLKDKVGKYIDNFVYTEQTNSIERVNSVKIRDSFLRLNLFIVSPCVMKQYLKVENLDFKGWIIYTSSIYEVINDNESFEEALHLKYNENADSCFIYQHIDGAHFPCEEYLDETEYCLKIFAEYINQLKSLGVYDNSVIIVAADHGLHDDAEGIPYGTVSTPMLMVKGNNEHHNEIMISKSPVYYQDFQASLLEYSGLYDDECRELFGKTFYDYKEGDIRTRVWFDQGFINASQWRKYSYRGDYDEFKRVVNDEEYIVVKDGSFDFSSLREQ